MIIYTEIMLLLLPRPISDLSASYFDPKLVLCDRASPSSTPKLDDILLFRIILAQSLLLQVWKVPDLPKLVIVAVTLRICAAGTRY